MTGTLDLKSVGTLTIPGGVQGSDYLLMVRPGATVNAVLPLQVPTSFVSITGATINGSGHLVLTKSDAGTLDLGSVLGAAGAAGPAGVGISNATLNGSGHLVLTKTDSSTIDVGGVVGASGPAGVGFTAAVINGAGHLVLTKTDASTIDLGTVVNTGTGAVGTPGVGIASAIINGSGHLILTKTDTSTIDAGGVIGPAGTIGPQGVAGATGVGISTAVVNGGGHLILTKTDSGTIDAGSVIGPAGPAASGETLDQESAAQAMSDTDAFPVAQPSQVGGSLGTLWRGTMAQLWSYITSKMPSYHIPVLELSAGTTLDGPTHNRRLLVCTTSLSMLIPGTFANLITANAAFEAEVQVETGATLTLPTTGATITGPATVVGPAQARIRAWTTSGAVNRFSCSQTTAAAGSGPTVAVSTPAGVMPSTAYTVSGSLTGYSTAPTLTYAVDGGSFVALPGGSTVTSSTFSFTAPGLAAGSHSIQIKDGNGVTSNTPSFTVAAAGAPTLTVTGVAPLTAGGTSTASFSFTNGAPASVTATSDGSALTIAAISITTTSGTNSTAAGTGSFTFTAPAVGAHTLVVTGTGTYAAVSAGYGYTTAAATPFALTSVTPHVIGVTGTAMQFDVTYTGSSMGTPTVTVDGSAATVTGTHDNGSGTGYFTITAPAPGSNYGAHTLTATGSSGSAQTTLFAANPTSTPQMNLYVSSHPATSNYPANLSNGYMYVGTSPAQGPTATGTFYTNAQDPNQPTSISERSLGGLINSGYSKSQTVPPGPLPAAAPGTNVGGVALTQASYFGASDKRYAAGGRVDSPGTYYFWAICSDGYSYVDPSPCVVS